VRARSGDLATSEAKVIALLIADPLFVGTSTTAQVAVRAGVSAPSVVRAARAIGFEGFADLKLEIARARGSADFFAPPPSLHADSDAAGVVENAVRAGVDALSALKGALAPDDVREAVAAIRECGQLLSYGAGPSATVAADVVFRMRAMGVRTAGVVDHESAMIAARLLSPGDVSVIVSSTGRTQTTLAVADAAASSGATVIAITDRRATPLAELARITLLTGAAPLSMQLAASASRLAQLTVVDALVATLALADPERVRRAERAGMDLPDMT
jgi:RpiR family carbohydrate utilization transcriptional regulator